MLLAVTFSPPAPSLVLTPPTFLPCLPAPLHPWLWQVLWAPLTPHLVAGGDRLVQKTTLGFCGDQERRRFVLFIDQAG